MRGECETLTNKYIVTSTIRTNLFVYDIHPIIIITRAHADIYTYLYVAYKHVYGALSNKKVASSRKNTIQYV